MKASPPSSPRVAHEGFCPFSLLSEYYTGMIQEMKRITHKLGDNSHMLKMVAQEDRRSLVLNMWLGSCTTPAQPRKLLVM